MPTASLHISLVVSISIVVPPKRGIIGANFRWAFLAARRQQRRSAGAGSVSMSISRSLEFELGVQAFEIPVDQRDRDFFSATPKNDRAIPLLQIAIHLDVSLHQNRILADDMHLDAAEIGRAHV